MGNRTPDLCIANATLYQLSYSPVQQGISYTRPRYGHQTGCGACPPAPGFHHGTSADSSRTLPRPHPGSAQSPPEMTTSVKVVHMSVPCVYSGRRAPWSYPQRRAVSTRPAQSATGAGGGYPHASVGRTGPDVREPRPTMWWDGARRCTHISVGMGVLALAAAEAAGNGVNEAVDAGL